MQFDRSFRLSNLSTACARYRRLLSGHAEREVAQPERNKRVFSLADELPSSPAVALRNALFCGEKTR